MFIDTIPNRKSPPAVLLRESYREGGRVKKRTLDNLSKLPPALIDGIVALLEGAKARDKRSAEPGFEIVRSLPHGHVAAVQAMIRKLGLDRMLQGRTGVEKRVCHLIEALIIQRIIAPGSKLAFHRALAPATATSSLALSVGLIDVAEREVYAALDWLIEQQTRIEGALAKRHLTDGTLVLYDVSSSYMEGRCSALAKPGYSRDHRPDRPQIVYGLLCAPDGTPVAVEVFEGNTSDHRTIGKQIDKHKMKKHFALDIADGRFTFHRRQEQIAAEAKLDGIYVIRTSLPANKIGSQAAVAAYKNLALVERAFRTLKGVDLQVRPVHHWLEHRVKAHVFLCMLAYYVEHHMRNALAPILFADHQPEARERASIVTPAQPSPAAIEKRTKRKTVDGTPIMAWHDLIAHLGTLTINEVALPFGERRTIHMLARPAALQQQAFALLGVPLPRVQ